ncbi:ScSEC23 cytoplasmic GTPase-activating protein-like protein [Scheffersomyces xylosifermentans]|uniref:ScSEC23 cytoplasmic GTPase-activating protein-like protein n=1 Tax=Scheffersomyces xylosifermentans TaxID=1304137 RepID=UPI00315C874E
MSSRFMQIEDSDGVRFNWNLFPSTRLEASRLSTPLGCLYQPLHKRSEVSQPIPCAGNVHPISCGSCGNLISPHIKVDRVNKKWWCPFCEKLSFWPTVDWVPEAKAATSEWPIELQQTSSTIEYQLPEEISEKVQEDLPFAYLFVVDVYEHVDNAGDSTFKKLVESLLETVESLPKNSLVGLISYEESVNILNFGSGWYTSFPKDFLNGTSKSYKSLFDREWVLQIFRRLNLREDSLPYDFRQSELVRQNILMELNDTNKPKIIEAFKSLKPRFTNSYKASRSSGLAHFITSVLLAQASYKNLLGKVIFLSSGPCTNYPGLIVNPDLKETIRSHKDVQDLNAPHFSSSSRFYEAISYIACGQSVEKSYLITRSSSTKSTEYDIPGTAPQWSIDLYSGSLDQVGMYEMKSLAEKTMGRIFLYETFDNSHFKRSLLSSVKVDNYWYKNTLTVMTSKDLKLSRMIFSGGYSLPSSYSKTHQLYSSHNEKISDSLSGFDSALTKKNFTNRWHFNALTALDTLSVFFEMNTARSSRELNDKGTTEVYIQFQLKYWDFKERNWKMRVTTIKRPTSLSVLLRNPIPLSNGTTKIVHSQSEIVKEHELLMSFDQECWVLLLARLLINKIDTTLGYEKFDDLVKLMDKIVIKLLYNFGGLSLKVNHNIQDSNPYSRLQQIYEVNEHFRFVPSLVYNLRKNANLINVFNSSPDETAYYHSWFLRLSHLSSITVIQPKLYKFNDADAIEIPLDTSCMEYPGGTIIILDTKFTITIFLITGENSKMNLHPSNNDDLVDSPPEILKAPLQFITTLLQKEERELEPKIILSQTNHSQARFLISRLDPINKDKEPQQIEVEHSSNHKSFLKFFSKSERRNPKSNVIMTEEQSLKQYYDGLIKSIGVYRIEDEN